MAVLSVLRVACHACGSRSLPSLSLSSQVWGARSRPRRNRWRRPPSSTADRATGRSAVPALRVTRQVSGMVIPWDVKPIGGGRLLITERNSGHLILWQNGHKRLVAFPSRSVWVSGETGLMGLEVDPDFASNGRFYTCQGGFTGGGRHEVHVIAWRLNAAATKATFQKELVGGFPTSSGRHGGCRLLILRGGALLVGTGDAAQGTNPQNQRSLGGKTLRLDRMTGAPSPFNPWPHADSREPPLRLHLRPPQRAGPRAAGRRQPLVGRARHRSATTRSTVWSRAATTATTRCPATTSPCR